MLKAFLVCAATSNFKLILQQLNEEHLILVNLD